MWVGGGLDAGFDWQVFEFFGVVVDAGLGDAGFGGKVAFPLSVPPHLASGAFAAMLG